MPQRGGSRATASSGLPARSHGGQVGGDVLRGRERQILVHVSIPQRRASSGVRKRTGSPSTRIYVFEIADRIHVHRLGRRVAVVSPGTTSMNQVVGLITGALRVGEGGTVEEVESAIQTGLSA